ncbi:hypothetical protein Tco_1499117 [Tanacetum coccineum]
MVPRTVLTKSSPISINTARPVNTVQPRTAVNNEGLVKNVNTVKGTRVNTGRPKAVLGAVKGNKGNDVKASTCWVLRPKHKVLDHGNTQQDLKDKGVIDSRCSRHMIGNRSYLIDYEEIDRGFVSFGDFKLTDESRVLLKVPRKETEYNVRFKEFVPPRSMRMYTLYVVFSLKVKVKLEWRQYLEKIQLPPLGLKIHQFSFYVQRNLLILIQTNRGEEKKEAVRSMNENSKVQVKRRLKFNQEKDASVNSTNTINTVSPSVNAADIEDNAVDENIVYRCDDDPNMPNLEDIASSENEVVFGAKADMTNLDTHIPVSPILTTRIHKDHPVKQIIGNIHSAPQTKRMTKSVIEHAMFKQFDWLADTDEEIDEHELEAHYSYMAKIQEVPNADSGTDAEPLEHVQYDTDDNVFANDIQHFEQSESISNTCAVETGDSNVILDSPDMCDNDI